MEKRTIKSENEVQKKVAFNFHRDLPFPFATENLPDPRVSFLAQLRTNFVWFRP